MTYFKRLLARLRKPEPVVLEVETVEFTSSVASESYRLGWQNGFWSGVLKGRADVVAELEMHTASRGKTLDEVSAEEVQRMKYKAVH